MSNKIKVKNTKMQADVDFYSKAYKDMGFYDMTRLLLGKGCVYFMFVIFPFVMYDGYFYITASRSQVFSAVSFFCFGVMLINEVIHFWVRKSKERHYAFSLEESKGKFHIPVYVIISAIFALSAVTAYFVSPYKDVAVLGQSGRSNGLLFVLAMCCIYVTVSRCYRFSIVDLHAAMIAACVANGLAVAHFAGLDVFNLFDNIADWQKVIFISTFGNIDVYGVYALFTTMISMVAFLLTKRARSRAVYGIYLMINFMGAVVCDADALVVGLAAGIIAVTYFIFDGFDNFFKYCQMLLIMILSGRILRLFTLVKIPGMRNLNGLLSVMVYSDMFWWIMLGMIVVLVLLYFCQSRCAKLSERLCKILRHIYVFLVCAGVAAGIGIAAYVNVVDNDAFGEFKIYLLFDAKWGSGRGAIWANVMEAYSRLPVVNKLFGAGEATIAELLSRYSSAHTSVIAGRNINDAHNILLQMLVTQGVAGLLSYMAFYAYGIVMTVKLWCAVLKKNAVEKVSKKEGGEKDNEKGRKKDNEAVGLLSIGLAVMTCFLQGIFCLFEPIAFPIVFSALGILNTYRGTAKQSAK